MSNWLKVFVHAVDRWTVGIARSEVHEDIPVELPPATVDGSSASVTFLSIHNPHPRASDNGSRGRWAVGREVQPLQFQHQGLNLSENIAPSLVVFHHHVDEANSADEGCGQGRDAGERRQTKTG